MAAMDTISALLFRLPPSLLVNVMTVVSSVVVAVIGLSEARGTAHLQYSKFWNANNSATKSSNPEKFKISSRSGMLLLYAPAALAGAVSFWIFPNDDLRILLLKSALTLHFVKRNFEVLKFFCPKFRLLLHSSPFLKFRLKFLHRYCLFTNTAAKWRSIQP